MPARDKDPAAVELGRRGGAAGKGKPLTAKKAAALRRNLQKAWAKQRARKLEAESMSTVDHEEFAGHEYEAAAYAWLCTRCGRWFDSKTRRDSHLCAASGERKPKE